MPKAQWYVEWFSDDQQWHYSVNEVIFKKKSPYQLIEILELNRLGRCLFLDHRLQSAECDEFIYHEALVHPSLLTHPLPERILIIGGGEGAVLREILKHPVREVVMVDIDCDVVDASIRYLPTWSCGAFGDSRVKLIFEDAREWVETTDEKFDCIISDLTEPIEDSPAKFLFTLEFYRKIHDILNPDGIFVLQGGTTVHFYAQFFASLVRTLNQIFPVVAPYQVVIPSFHWPWGFIIGSRNYDAREIGREILRRRITERNLNTRYYNHDLHYAIFVLPTYLNALLKRGQVLTDKSPYIWEG